MTTTNDSAGNELARLVDILQKLRAPDGCPWDKEQTHQSLRPYLIEETYEVLDAIDREAFPELKKELGDVLLHIAFHAQIAAENNLFDLHDVVHALNEKLIHRHPHVFGNTKVSSASDVNRQWEQIKLNETHKPKLLDGVPANQPALNRAFRVQEKAAAVGFDWPSADPVWNKIDEEIVELKREVSASSQSRMEAEFGDLLFSMVNLGRKLGISPEDALRTSIAKFTRRFSYIEERLEAEGKKLHETTLETMDSYWDEAKRLETEKYS